MAIDLEELSKEELIEKLERCREALSLANDELMCSTANQDYCYYKGAVGDKDRKYIQCKSHEVIGRVIKEVFGEGEE